MPYNPNLSKLVATTHLTKLFPGSGFGSVGRPVASKTRDVWFESRHRQNVIYLFYIRNTKIDKKRPGMAHLLKQHFFPSFQNGFITPTELKRALARMDIRMGKVEFVRMLKRVDTDKDGQISFKEFVVMMLSDAMNI